jgi:hypothetical protein
LYDLASDPSESVNIAEKKPFVKNEMKKAVSKWLATTGKQKKEVTRTQLDAESVEKLKSLGYVE